MSPAPAYVRYSLVLLGVMFLFAGALHVWWHWVLPGLGSIRPMTVEAWHFLCVFNWAIAVLCTVQAATAFALAAAPRTGPREFAIFVWPTAAFWTGRFVIELVFPVELPILGTRPSPIFLALMLAGLAALILPQVAWWRARKEQPAPSTF